MAGNNAISSGLLTLAGILERKRARGAETLAVSPASIAILQGMPDVFRTLATAARQSEKNQAVTMPENASSQPPGKGLVDPSAPSGQPAREADGKLVGPGFEIPLIPEHDRTEGWRRAQLNAIFKAVKQAPEPRSLGTLFETLVFAAGDPGASIVFVGEAPGAEEEKQKKPFVGPAGQKLDQILKAMGLGREQVYISNIVKFRPKKGDGRFQGSSNRAPTQEEMATCLPFIRAEIEVLRPLVIVALGRIAAEGLLEKGGAISSFRNAEHLFGGIPVIVTYHPSYLLRQEAASPEDGKLAKRQVWEDMLRAMDLAGMTVSEKQRSYFL